jgi:hypothetical protein
VRAAVEQAILDLGGWLCDNTVEVFEEQPEIDTIRGQLQDALDKVQDDHVQTSMCIWEHLFGLRDTELFATQGICEMRDRAVELTPWVEEVYALMDPEAKDMEAFDLGIVPMILDWVEWDANGRPTTHPAGAIADQVSDLILNRPPQTTYRVLTSRRFVSRHVNSCDFTGTSPADARAKAQAAIDNGTWDPTDDYVEQGSGWDDADPFEIDDVVVMVR